MRRRVAADGWAITTFTVVTYPGPGRRILDRWSGCHATRLLDVARHLGDQVVDGLEALLAAEALEERQPQLAAVEVALEPEQERLGEHAVAGDERGAHADARGRRPRRPRAVELDRRPARVDAERRAHERGVGHEVGGGIAERAAAHVPVHHGSAHGERGA